MLPRTVPIHRRLRSNITTNRRTTSRLCMFHLPTSPTATPLSRRLPSILRITGLLSPTTDRSHRIASGRHKTLPCLQRPRSATCVHQRTGTHSTRSTRSSSIIGPLTLPPIWTLTAAGTRSHRRASTMAAPRLPLRLTMTAPLLLSKTLYQHPRERATDVRRRSRLPTAAVAQAIHRSACPNAAAVA